MGNQISQGPTIEIIAAIILPNQKIQAGSSLLVEAQSEEEQKKLTEEIAKAVKGDVTRLSNGAYLIMRG